MENNTVENRVHPSKYSSLNVFV